MKIVKNIRLGGRPGVSSSSETLYATVNAALDTETGTEPTLSLMSVTEMHPRRTDWLLSGGLVSHDNYPETVGQPSVSFADNEYALVAQAARLASSFIRELHIGTSFMPTVRAVDEGRSEFVFVGQHYTPMEITVGDNIHQIYPAELAICSIVAAHEVLTTHQEWQDVHRKLQQQAWVVPG